MERTDIHRPSVIEPTEYEFVAFDYLRVDSLGDALMLKAQRDVKAEHMARTGGHWSRHEHGGSCMVCGNVNAVYTVCFWHRPTNVYLHVGQDCAQKMDMSYDDESFNAFRAGVRDAINRKAGKAKAQAMLADLGASRAWEIFAEHESMEWKGFESKYKAVLWETDRIVDMVRKLVQYGSWLSDKQRDFLVKLATTIDSRAENKASEEARRKAAHDAAPDVPEGKVEIVGTILTVREPDQDDRFPSTKILVQHDSGWKVWGSMPSQTYPILQVAMVDGNPQSTPEQFAQYQKELDAYKSFEKGDRIRFTATVERSKDDPKFGFFKRPRKATHAKEETTA